MEPYRKPEYSEKSDSVNYQKKKKDKNQLDLQKVKDDRIKTKPKAKFLPLFNKEGNTKSVVQIPGRHPCQCLATKHKLISNCLRCGRIVCAQEGSGPCFTCNSLVCTREEREIIRRGDRKSELLLKKLSPNDGSVLGLKEIANQLQPNQTVRIQEGLSKAIEQKKQLLEFDRTSEKRTQVIDDEADYFSVDSNQWLTKNQRQTLKKRLEELNEKRNSRRNKITFDFAGRRIIEENQVVDIHSIDDAIVQEIFYGDNANEWSDTTNSNAVADLDYKPTYTPTDDNKISSSMSVITNRCRQMRIQDKELQEMSDEGKCLTVHQPYASLLISGIKRHEGRSWYTPHRGRLWIASANKQPLSSEIRDVESVYKMLSEGVRFPEQYPVGCLLGCVDLIDCISQEQYREEFPEGESTAPYVFLCDNARELIVKFPIQGKPKIYKLDQRIHQAAQKTLERKLN